ncbi:hypothetical protein NJT12_17415 [Flavobacterium sp. AC]|uniref:TonB-dependent receptor plug domain-containing protein n=1 Tax=Flavobacterium azizsancarii TaxID=2961580 RepID=A0ABT4WGR3_9FLAO|nr:hypothetical protein [Flavobacterium azizsancarii]MDA6071402.1 hypothetical protein [Flavobacterium azizsancarii]
MLPRKQLRLIKSPGGRFGKKTCYFKTTFNKFPLMKRALLLFISTIIIACSKPKAFILNDTKENKYFVLESVNNAFEKNQIDKSPLIVINGIPFKYNKEQDTIILPLKRSEILSLDFLNINSSRIVYNDKENDGAVIITTKSKTKSR